MWTQADAIIDYLVFAKHYISECEEIYGEQEVEKILDASHSLMNYGVDRYRHPPSLSIHEEKIRQHNREVYLESQINELWRTLPPSKNPLSPAPKERFPHEPQENILYFIEKMRLYLNLGNEKSFVSSVNFHSIFTRRVKPKS